MKPLLTVPGLVRHLQADGRWDDVNGIMAHAQPLALRFREHHNAATFGPRATLELTAGAPQRREARSWPWDVGVAEDGLQWRHSPLIDRPVRCFALSAFVEVASEDDSAKLQAQVADEEHLRNAHGPPSCALVVDMDVGDGEVGARRVGRPAELAGNHHALNGPTKSTRASTGPGSVCSTSRA